MHDHLFIDTDRTRDAAAHLRSMYAGGEDILTDIRIAAGLAGLADSIASDFGAVSEALSELASVLDQRSNLADRGGVVVPTAATAQLMGISQVLWGFNTPTTDELFPTLDHPRARTERAAPTDCPPIHDELVQHDELGMLGWLGDRADDALEWMSDQPVVPPPLNPLDLFNAVQDLEENIIDVVTAQDLGPVDGPIDRYLEGFANPLLPPFVLSPLTPLYDHALDNGIVRGTVAVGVVGLTVGATTIDDEPRLGGSITVGPKGTPGVSVLYTPTNIAPGNGDSESLGVCAGPCAGATKTDGELQSFFGFGSPGLIAGTTYEHWFELRDGD